jgi:hypothetical protein
MKIKILCALSIILGTGNSFYASAQTDSSATKVQSVPFKLSATKVELSLDQLNDVGLDLKNILTVSGHLYDEVMVQPVTVITEPEMIAGTVIDIPVGTQPTGPPRPARKERVDLLMSQMRPIIDLLKKNADDFMHESQVTEYSDDMKTKIDPLFKKWLAYMDDVYAKLLEIEKLTVGPTYDNYAIAERCKLIEKDVKQIDEVRRPIYKLIQEEGKSLIKSN